MPTYLDLRTRIARNLWRARSATDCEYDPDIKSAVASAIRAYQGRDFWFAEQDWRAELPTVAGQQYYPLPEDMASIRNVRVLDGDRWRPVEPIAEADVDAVGARRSPGRPEFYCVINRQFRLAPTPSGPFTLDMTGTRLVPPPENDGDANEWTNDALDLIVFEAEKVLWATLKKEPAQAALCAQLAEEALQRLRVKTQRFKPWPAITGHPGWNWPC